MRQRFTLHLLLIFALLFAQQAGFVHALSHLAPASDAQLAAQITSAQAPAPTDTPGPAPENTRHQYQACAQCLVVTLAGGAVSSQTHILGVLAAAAGLNVAEPQAQFSQHTSTPFLARAPPVTA